MRFERLLYLFLYKKEYYTPDIDYHTKAMAAVFSAYSKYV